MARPANPRRRPSSRRLDPHRHRLRLELLEERRLLAGDWRNPVDSLDVDNDHQIAPLDALLVINYTVCAHTESLRNVQPNGSV